MTIQITDKHLAELCHISNSALRIITARAEFRKYEISYNGRIYKLCDGLIDELHKFFKIRAYTKNPSFAMKEAYENNMQDLRQYYNKQKELESATARNRK